MKLKNAAKYFDRDSVYDAYTAAFLFKGQFGNLDGNSFGSFQRRRIVSVAPTVLPAPRRVVVIQAEQWLMGEFVEDTWLDEVIRKTSSAKKVTDEYTLLTPGQAALRYAPGTLVAFAQTEHLKDTVNSNTDSAYGPQYEIFFGSTEVIPDGWFLKSTDHFVHIRSVHTDLEGYVVATSDECENAEVDVEFEGDKDMITELPSPGLVTTGLLIDMYKLYYYMTEADRLNRQGDMTLIVAKSGSWEPRNNQLVTVNGEKWRNFGYTPYMDSWNIHLKRA